TAYDIETLLEFRRVLFRSNPATVAAEADPATPVVGTTGDAPQQPSGMPTHKYLPFHEQIRVELPDRTWPTRRITRAPRWCAVDQIGRASCRERGTTAVRAV